MRATEPGAGSGRGGASAPSSGARGNTTLFSVLSRTVRMSEAQVLDCVRRMQPDLPVGALLTELGLIAPVQLRQALQQQVQDGFRQRVGENLIGKRMMRERDLTRVLAAQSGYRSEEPEIDECDAALLGRLPRQECERLGLLPIRITNEGSVTSCAGSRT